ncbi:Exocyst complex component SEC3A [Camellia lanceoleosa]|uniref:Exocyst complex component SEC3A n=1 Tax=Camellia lanceoleosa TaxID=1840588 RepID=A0ACC0HGL8_9ERIC|nr:Exocyst complex component SEC3A [Camellia lanceoleosa]
MSFELVPKHQEIQPCGLKLPQEPAKVQTMQILLQVLFAHFMCFEVPALVPPRGVASGNKTGLNDDDTNDDDLGILDIDENGRKTDGAALPVVLIINSNDDDDNVPNGPLDYSSFSSGTSGNDDGPSGAGIPLPTRMIAPAA